MRGSEAVTEEKIKAYIAVLSDISPDVLERALVRCGQECEWFPSAVEIRQRCENPQLAAEQSWEFLQRVMRKNWHPDIGFYGDAPRLDQATEYAVRQCGGMNRINDATDKQFSFIRTEFLTAYGRFQEEGGEQTRISQQLAESMFQKLQDASRPALPERQETLERAADGVTSPTQPERKVWTAADHEARMRLLREQAEKLKGKSA
jgi:hypothetical protein